MSDKAKTMQLSQSQIVLLLDLLNDKANQLQVLHEELEGFLES